jgi:hypothetical protein
MKEAAFLSVIRHSDGLRAGWKSLESQGGDEIFLFSTAYRPALGPTQPPIQWVPGALSSAMKRLRNEADHPPTSSTEVKTGRAVLPFPHTSTWPDA